MSRREWKWTEYQLDKLNKVMAVLNELDEYRPLTLRQVYYQLVGKGYIENTVSQYTQLSTLMKWARIDGYVSWDDIEDRVRAFHDLRGIKDADTFIEYETDVFLSGYRRDLLQSQEKVIEVWIEKDALSSIFQKVAARYTVPVVVCRGYSSVSFLHEYRRRLSEAGDKQPVMLYFGDFDPSGLNMFETMQETLETELDTPGIIYKRIALLREDIKDFNLPHEPEALKRTDTRSKRFLEEHGALAVELDALHPMVLERRIRVAIEDELDIEAFDSEVRQYRDEIGKLHEIRENVIGFMNRQG